MNRRHFLVAQTLAFSGVAMADLPKVQALDDALRWLDKLGTANDVHLGASIARFNAQ